ncbi:MarR family transcriptional regulator [Streptomyces sp. SID11233]|nr:MarR family transcriptional regulator [Streptomyces sp. SID11233]
MFGAVPAEVLPVSGIARSMGITRQAVRRAAGLLVGKGLAEYVLETPVPGHGRGAQPVLIRTKGPDSGHGPATTPRRGTTAPLFSTRSACGRTGEDCAPWKSSAP